MSVRITFYGAAQTVTGSKYLLESARSKVLVDCGLFQGHKELRLRNWAEPPFDVEELDAVVITHAHVDHAGYLPLIVRRGYRGPVYCTAATKELLKLLLPDTARLQEEEARFANKRGSSKHRPALPLFGEADAAQALKQLRPLTRSSAAIVAPG
ncbi:MAG TPA: MBL fold metallo-hydrolase, partial [Oligoflexia bacterium]|nr:MBL fold metallo-hydrolase [Oligoflexia bacterium]